MAIKLIIGLRNPGSSYEHTRHNAGEWFLSALVQRDNTSFRLEKKLHAELTELQLNHCTSKLILPTTFMNQSDQPARLVSQFYRIQPEEILIIHDELDLAPGRIKLKTGGGHGGHNGLKDIISQLGTPNFHRLRIGIGHPGHKDLVHSYVLGKPSLHDKQEIYNAIDRGIDIMPLIFAGDLANAMNQLNSDTSPL